MIRSSFCPVFEVPGTRELICLCWDGITLNKFRVERVFETGASSGRSACVLNPIDALPKKLCVKFRNKSDNRVPIAVTFRPRISYGNVPFEEFWGMMSLSCLVTSFKDHSLFQPIIGVRNAQGELTTIPWDWLITPVTLGDKASQLDIAKRIRKMLSSRGTCMSVHSQNITPEHIATLVARSPLQKRFWSIVGQSRVYSDREDTYDGDTDVEECVVVTSTVDEETESENEASAEPPPTRRRRLGDVVNMMSVPAPATSATVQQFAAAAAAAICVAHPGHRSASFSRTTVDRATARDTIRQNKDQCLNQLMRNVGCRSATHVSVSRDSRSVPSLAPASCAPSVPPAPERHSIHSLELSQPELRAPPQVEPQVASRAPPQAEPQAVTDSHEVHDLVNDEDNGGEHAETGNVSRALEEEDGAEDGALVGELDGIMNSVILISRREQEWKERALAAEQSLAEMRADAEAIAAERVEHERVRQQLARTQELLHNIREKLRAVASRTRVAASAT